MNLNKGEKMKILIVAPHPDDEVLGCGGIISKYISQGHEVHVAIITKTCEPVFPADFDEKNKTDCLNAHKILGVTKTHFLDFPAAMLESVPRHEFNSAIIKLIKDVAPEEVYIPHRGDMHLDHKMVVDACMVALRPRFDYVTKRIYAYETLSESEWDIPNTTNIFIPNVYVDITDYFNNKLEAMKQYKNQLSEYPNPRSLQAIEALAMLRGSTISKKYAESFMLIRDIK